MYPTAQHRLHTWFFIPSSRAFLRCLDLREWSLFLIRFLSSFSSGVMALSSSLSIQ